MQRHGESRLKALAALSVVVSIQAFAQAPADPNATQEPESKRILGIIPNFRTATLPSPYKPLTPGEKFKIATEDSFDRGTIALGLIFGAYGQMTASNRAYGDGAAAYARYAAAAYADFVIGDYMTEAIYPTLLHQDPRYFRRGTGSGLSRFGYAVGQIFWTHNDSGRTQFNFSEICGNSTAVAISNAYYQNARTAQDAGVQLGVQLGVDAASNVLKEFWPDIKKKAGWLRGSHEH
jgi:hypothetical protein